MKLRHPWRLLLVVLAGSASMVMAQSDGSGAVQSFPVNRLSAEAARQQFANEPTLQQVFLLAAEHADLRVDRIRSWMKKASKRNLWPELKLNADWTGQDNKSVSDTYSIREDPDRTIIGPPDATIADNNRWNVDLTMTWDLNAIILDRAAVKDMTLTAQRVLKMRNELLTQVSGLYSERRRHQIELAMLAPSDELVKAEKQLRIDELTAQLDVLTGGKFSNMTGGGR